MRGAPIMTVADKPFRIADMLDEAKLYLFKDAIKESDAPSTLESLRRLIKQSNVHAGKMLSGSGLSIVGDDRNGKSIQAKLIVNHTNADECFQGEKVATLLFVSSGDRPDRPDKYVILNNAKVDICCMDNGKTAICVEKKTVKNLEDVIYWELFL